MATIKKKRVDTLINFKIEKDLLTALDSFANKKGWNRSMVIREAIKTYIMIYGKKDKKLKKFPAEIESETYHKLSE